jgi:hypothetical protein
VRRERRYGSFSRSIALPDGVDAKQITATTRDGVVEVKIPCARASEEGDGHDHAKRRLTPGPRRPRSAWAARGPPAVARRQRGLVCETVCADRDPGGRAHVFKPYNHDPESIP